MRSYTLAAKLAELGIELSFSRPRVSNYNAYAGSLFRTLKYHQSYPHRRFPNLLSVRVWADSFVEWYNAEHRHSGIKYVTPNQRHYGEADAIFSIRQQTYEQARLRHPRRWA
jgi:transposase InsO family protein